MFYKDGSNALAGACLHPACCCAASRQPPLAALSNSHHFTYTITPACCAVVHPTTSRPPAPSPPPRVRESGATPQALHQHVGEAVVLASLVAQGGEAAHAIWHCRPCRAAAAAASGCRCCPGGVLPDLGWHHVLAAVQARFNSPPKQFVLQFRQSCRSRWRRHVWRGRRLLCGQNAQALPQEQGWSRNSNSVRIVPGCCRWTCCSA